MVVKILRDSIVEVDVIKNRIENLERELYGIERMKHKHNIDLQRYIDRKYKLENEIAILQDMLEDKEQACHELKEKLGTLNGLENVVAYKKYVEGKTLKQIAKDLGYSYPYIKRISSRI